MILNNKQKQYLKGLAHSLKPVVLLGQHGLTEGVLAEIDLALGLIRRPCGSGRCGAPPTRVLAFVAFFFAGLFLAVFAFAFSAALATGNSLHRWVIGER